MARLPTSQWRSFLRSSACNSASAIRSCQVGHHGTIRGVVSVRGAVSASLSAGRVVLNLSYPRSGESPGDHRAA